MKVKDEPHQQTGYDLMAAVSFSICRSLLAGDLARCSTMSVPNRLQAGSYIPE